MCVPISSITTNLRICFTPGVCRIFYNSDGSVINHFNYNSDRDQREFTSITLSPFAGVISSAATTRFLSFLFSFHFILFHLLFLLSLYLYSCRLPVFSYSNRNGIWEFNGQKKMRNFYALTAICWRGDGARIAGVSSTDCVEEYEAWNGRVRYKGQFEFMYTSLLRVLISFPNTSYTRWTSKAQKGLRS